MAFKLAEAFVSITGRDQELRQNINKTKGAITGIVGQLGTVLAGLGLGVGLSSFLGGAREAIALAKEQVDVEQRLKAVITATSGAAGLSFEQMKKFASEMQGITTIGDEEWLNSMSIIATFRNITGDTFKETTKLAADMAQNLGTDVKSAAIQLGKALNDPTKNMSALSRSGIQLNAQQTSMIKKLQASGDLLGAQNIILAEVKKNFGGLAEEVAKSDFGRLKQAQDILGDLKEDLGKAIVPLFIQFTKVTIGLQKVINTTIIGFTKLNKTFFGIPAVLASVTGAVVGLTLALKAYSVTTGTNVTITTLFRGAINSISGVATRATATMVSLTTSTKLYRLALINVRGAISKTITMMKALIFSTKTLQVALVGSGVGVFIVALGFAVVGIIKLVKEIGKIGAVQKAWAAAVEKFKFAWINLKKAASNVFTSLATIANRVMGGLSKLFGIELGRMSTTFSGRIVEIINKFSNFVENAALFIRVITEDWGAAWELMKTVAKGGIEFYIKIWKQQPEIFAFAFGRIMRFAIDAFNFMSKIASTWAVGTAKKIFEVYTNMSAKIAQIIAGVPFEDVFSGFLFDVEDIETKVGKVGAAFQAGFGGKVKLSDIIDLEFPEDASRAIKAFIEKMKKRRDELQTEREKIDEVVEKKIDEKTDEEIEKNVKVNITFGSFDQLNKAAQEMFNKIEEAEPGKAGEVAPGVGAGAVGEVAPKFLDEVIIPTADVDLTTVGGEFSGLMEGLSGRFVQERTDVDATVQGMRDISTSLVGLAASGIPSILPDVISVATTPDPFAGKSLDAQMEIAKTLLGITDQNKRSNNLLQRIADRPSNSIEVAK